MNHIEWKNTRKISGNIIFKTIIGTVHPNPKRLDDFATSVRHIGIFRAGYVEETRHFLTPPNCNLIYSSEASEL